MINRDKVILALAIGVCGWWQSLPAALVTVSANQNLTKAAGNQYETSVDINPTNSQLVFMASRNELGGLYTARSTNGGQKQVGISATNGSRFFRLMHP